MPGLEAFAAAKPRHTEEELQEAELQARQQEAEEAKKRQEKAANKQLRLMNEEAKKNLTKLENILGVSEGKGKSTQSNLNLQFYVNGEAKARTYSVSEVSVDIVRGGIDDKVTGYKVNLIVGGSHQVEMELAPLPVNQRNKAQLKKDIAQGIVDTFDFGNKTVMNESLTKPPKPVKPKSPPTTQWTPKVLGMALLTVLTVVVSFGAVVAGILTGNPGLIASGIAGWVVATPSIAVLTNEMRKTARDRANGRSSSTNATYQRVSTVDDSPPLVPKEASGLSSHAIMQQDRNFGPGRPGAEVRGGAAANDDPSHTVAYSALHSGSNGYTSVNTAADRQLIRTATARRIK